MSRTSRDMLIDFRIDDTPLQYEGADVCIVGSGAAGLTLARRLVTEGRQVLLLESGGIDYAADTSNLNDGENVGHPYYDLEDSRLRFFGGTTAIWGGRCAELDAIDFEKRDWLPWSGWPFGKETLAPWYAQARAELQLPTPPPVGDDAARVGFDRRVTELVYWQFDDRADRFGYAANQDLIQHPRLRVLLHATVTGLQLDRNGAAIEHLRISSLNGRLGEVRARTYVLAAGGLENPRLLLNSRSQMSTGIGNTHDLVGRFFMEHPHARGGRLHIGKSWQTLRLFSASNYDSAQRYAATLRASDTLQRERHILNSSLTPRVRPHPDSDVALGMRIYTKLKHSIAPTRNGRLLWRASKRFSTWTKRGLDPLRPWLLTRLNRRGIYLSVRAEQAPNPDSRVRLGDGYDALGQRRLALDWRLSEIDKRTVRTIATSLDQSLRAQHAGRVEPATWLDADDQAWEIDPLIGAHPIGGYHHIGTTRMHNDPRKGVVDANSRVHGIGNLYIAGSSVFPTSGWANPTLTIVALSLRLADHLHRRALETPRTRSSVVHTQEREYA